MRRAPARASSWLPGSRGIARKTGLRAGEVRPPDTLLTRPGFRSDNEAKYRSRNPVVRHLVARFLARVSRLVAEAGPRRILEAGCGEGVVMRYLMDRHPGLRVDGLELDREALDRARARNPGSLLLQGDLYALGLRSRAYDLVLCLEVLEHLPEPERALAELRRVSRARVILSVPHEPFFRLGNVLRGKNLGRFGDPPDHVQHWGKRAFQAFSARHLRVDRTVGAFPWLIVVASV